MNIPNNLPEHLINIYIPNVWCRFGMWSQRLDSSLVCDLSVTLVCMRSQYFVDLFLFLVFIAASRAVNLTIRSNLEKDEYPLTEVRKEGALQRPLYSYLGNLGITPYVI